MSEATGADMSSLSLLSDSIRSLSVDQRDAVDGEVYSAEANGAVLVVEEAEGSGNAYYSVIADENQTQQEFTFHADGQPAILELVSIEGWEVVLISSRETGEIVNFVSPAWAIDSNGTSLSTRYEVRGSTLIQVTDLDGAAFPVVADPKLACNGLHCTVQYNRNETRQVANMLGGWTGVISTGCTILAGAVGGFICAIVYGHAQTVAQNAYSEGKCVGIQVLIAAPGVPYPVSYSGGNCV